MKNTYSIGQVEKMFNLSIYTLRYYDKEGLLPNLKKNKSGIREFNDENLKTLQVIKCLKTAGMSMEEIKQYMQLAIEGDSSLNERLKIIKQTRHNIQKQIQDLKYTLDVVNFKYDYYQTAIKYGSEKEAQTQFKEMPTRKNTSLMGGNYE